MTRLDSKCWRRRLINCNLKCFGSLITPVGVFFERAGGVRCALRLLGSRWKRKFQRCCRRTRKKSQKFDCPIARQTYERERKLSDYQRSNMLLWMSRKFYKYIWRENFYDTTILDTHTMTQNERKNPLKWRQNNNKARVYKLLYTHVPNIWARFH